MLVLTRKIGEKIVIETPNGTITVRIGSIDRDKVRLGIDAPPSIRIDREEVHRLRETKECQKSCEERF